MILTTTHAVDGFQVVRYFNPVVANVVFGTSIIVDFIASLSDTFGGRSKTYQEYMDRMYTLAQEELVEKSEALGANCILGVTYSPGELSGKGFQMMTVMATGTPVIIKSPSQLAAEEQQRRDHEVEQVLADEARRERIKSVDALLQDNETLAHTKELRRIFGSGAAVDYLREVAREIGIDGTHLNPEDLADL